MIATTMMTISTTRTTMHNGGMSNKCNQYGNASFRASDLKTHLKTLSGEKSFYIISILRHLRSQAFYL